MKKSVEISMHLLFWAFFTTIVWVISKMYLQVKPDAPFGQHFFHVMFLELIMGLIFFYTPFFCLPWAMKKNSNGLILGIILIFLVLFFAFPAMKVGALEVMSSVIPHVFLIFLALIIRRFTDLLKLHRV